MRQSIWAVILLIAVGSGLRATTSITHAVNRQTVEQKHRGHWWKFENGLLISWLVTSKDASMDDIEIFDKSGSALTQVNVLRTVEDAERVSIYDVSARSGQMIAVAAVFRSKTPGIRPSDALLCFDFDGNLLSAFALEPSREIRQLSLDENLNIWTLTTHSDHKDPSQIPLVVEYDKAGNVVRQLLTRSMFPPHEAMFDENSTIGSVASGYDSGILWFWLPMSTDLVTIHAADATVGKIKTGLPSGDPVPMRVVRQTSGSIVVEVREQSQGSGKAQPAYYLWSPGGGIWSRFEPRCDGYRLIGTEGDQEIFVDPISSGICTSAP